MNIFKLDNDPVQAAQLMCDKHVVKMVTEYGQLLSTAHRILDGEQYTDKTKNGRNIKRWRLAGDAIERLLYKASHVNHPSNIWCRENDKNYRWLYKHFQATAKEYERRYGRVHKTYTDLGSMLWLAPKNIKQTAHESVMPQCMPDHCKRDDVVEGYRNYYRTEKSAFATWKNAVTPEWMS